MSHKTGARLQRRCSGVWGGVCLFCLFCLFWTSSGIVLVECIRHAVLSGLSVALYCIDACYLHSVLLLIPGLVTLA